jgi:hypothetical protein
VVVPKKLELNAAIAVFYADPPWQYEIHQLAMNRSIERHYQTMPIEARSAAPRRG